MAHEVPIIDISPIRGDDEPARRRLADAVNEALERIGFLVVVGHEIPADVTRRTYRAAAAFFDRDLDDKNLIRIVPGTVPRGYLPYGAVALAQTEGEVTPPDAKESFGMGPERLQQNRWPEGDDEFRDASIECFTAMESVMTDMVRVFALCLDLDEHWFVTKFEGHDSTLRLFNYPEMTQQPLPGQLRSGAHTDYGALTILSIGDDDPGGLQVRSPAGEWVDVVAPPGSFVINVGDLLMMWSNDRWLSNLHRVVLPADPARATQRRQSMGFFANPRADVLIECLPNCSDEQHPPLHAPIPAGEHRLAKVRASEPVASR
jgi:isopenicillin N synthase-like dioxygenase